MQGWMMTSKPEEALKGMMQEESTYTPEEMNQAATEIANDPRRRAVLPKLVEIMYAGALYPHCLDALKVELQTVKERTPLEDIKAPTLICHGDKDGDVPLAQAEQANSLIPNSELYIVEGGMHLLILHAKYEEMFKAQVEFAKKHT